MKTPSSESPTYGWPSSPELLLDLVPDALLLVGADGNIRHVNRPFSALFGYPAADIIGKTVETLVPERYSASHVQLRADYWRTPSPRGMAHDRHVQARRADGTTFVAAIILNPLDEGAVLCSVRDVSRQLEFERRLVESERLASIGLFDATLAHEINNLIQYVGCCVPLLREGVERLAPDTTIDTEDLIATIAGVERSMARVSATVRAVRSLSHPASSETSPCDLHEVIEEVLVLGRALWQHRCRIDEDLAALRTMVDGHRDQLVRVLVNLISNAVDAANTIPSPTPTVLIHTHSSSTHITLVVADNGPGVPESIREKIFAPFFTTKAPRHGNGLGLSQASQIIMEHGGSLCLDVSRVGDKADSDTPIVKGARFVATLPLIKEACQPADLC